MPDVSAFRLPESLLGTGDPFPENPFSPDDPRYRVWEEATRVAEIESARLNSDILSWTPTGSEDQIRRTLTLYVGKFDIWARRYVYVLWSDAAVQDYVRWLFEFANRGIDAAATSCPAPNSAERVAAELRLHFMQRTEFWKSEALGYLAEIKSQQASHNKSSNQPTSPTAAVAKTEQSPTLSQRLANPAEYPTMGINEVRQALGNISRSTIYRWVDEGKLLRAHTGKEPGKRSRMLILTSSVIARLSTSPE